MANRIEMPRLLAEGISAEDFEPSEFAQEAEKAAAKFLTERVAGLLNQSCVIGANLFVLDFPHISVEIDGRQYLSTDVLSL